MGYVKCRCDSCKFATFAFDAKPCQLRSVARYHTERPPTCLQHVRRDAARRAGLPATADPLYSMLKFACVCWCGL